MPTLGDYLGQLLSEIAMARMQADLETVRLAEMYASHPLLRTLPVPHIRLPNVDLDVPVIIKGSESPQPGESTRGSAQSDRLGQQFDDVLARQLAKKGLDVPAAVMAELAASLKARLGAHAQPTEISVGVHRLADDLSETTAKLFRDREPAGPLGRAAAEPSFLLELKEASRLAFLKLRSPPPRLNVAVTSAEIREAGSPDNLTRLRLKVSEQGLEWTSIESEEGPRDRLIPE